MKTTKTSNWMLLFNPFTRIAGWKAFGVGAVIVAITVVLAHMNNIYFNGALDSHYLPERGLGIAFLYQGISLACIVLVMYIVALISARGTRFQDIIGTTTLARFPYLLIALSGFLVDPGFIFTVSEDVMRGAVHPIDLAKLLAISVTMLVPALWYLVVLFFAFRESTGLKGLKCALLYITSVFLAEIISIGAIYFVSKNVL